MQMQKHCTHYKHCEKNYTHYKHCKKHCLYYTTRSFHLSLCSTSFEFKCDLFSYTWVRFFCDVMSSYKYLTKQLSCPWRDVLQALCLHQLRIHRFVRESDFKLKARHLQNRSSTVQKLTPAVQPTFIYVQKLELLENVKMIIF